ncbi:hypothetical protein FSP39_012284 [Pinctada imbricata]|uniref:Uncharacterized protein n=1 Tax=Pinctada imbricata TaxID=66713 RepID=A0AA88Y3R9_PINIB|nr:hypothetical protein FSP39_012284 [Pinctada imbricata]
MCVFIPTGKVSNQFNSECILYSHLKVSLSDKDQVILDTRKEATVWGNPSTCNYVTYTPVVASLNSMIWCWFLYQNALKNDSGTSQSVLALLFSCIFHLLFTVVLLVSSCFLSAGKTAFCDDLGLQIPRYKLYLYYTY